VALFPLFPRPGMAEIYDCSIEILPKHKHTGVNQLAVPNPTTSTIIPYHPVSPQWPLLSRGTSPPPKKSVYYCIPNQPITHNRKLCPVL